MILNRNDYFTPRQERIEQTGIFSALHCGKAAIPAWHRNKFKGWTCSACFLWFPAKFTKPKVKRPVSRKAFAIYEQASLF